MNSGAVRREGGLGRIKERLDKVWALIQEPEFLKGKGLSNEVNIRILCYGPENKEVKGIRSVKCFRKKFQYDPTAFMLIDRATKGLTETILFNIDIEGFSNKDKTAVLWVLVKMFYNHLGFYGENLKVAMMECYIDQQGKTEESCRIFEEKKGKFWLEMRRAFAFNGKFIIPTLMEVLDMSGDDAKDWFNDKTATEISIAQLVEDMKTYVDTKPANFRLLFMIDEVGQYVGTDTDMLLNLQSLTKKIGGERSMLSGFQEAAQKVQEKDEYALVLFFRFYDTIHTFLDGSIRRVIERCQKAADKGSSDD